MKNNLRENKCSFRQFYTLSVNDFRRSASSLIIFKKRSRERSLDSELKDLDSGLDSDTTYLSDVEVMSLLCTLVA